MSIENGDALLTQFIGSGDYNLLTALDAMPATSFNDYLVQRQTYMRVMSAHSDHFTCFQHAMTYALDHHHPGITSYIARRYPVNKFAEQDEDFVEILNRFLRAGNRHTFEYTDLVTADELMDKERVVQAFETRVADSGYVIAFKDMFHGELYTLQQVGEDRYLTLVLHGHGEPIRLWKEGESSEWLRQENTRISGFARMIERDFLTDDWEYERQRKQSLQTRFFGKPELHRAIQEERNLIELTHIPEF